jgi:hypothetical protein
MKLQAKTWCEINAKSIKTGHGIFLEFKDMPNFEKAVKQYFVMVLGWFLEYENTFVRKPKNTYTCN